MTAEIRFETSRIVQECVEKMKAGQLAPWKVEDDLASSFGIDIPENFRLAALCRQSFIQAKTGEQFRYIRVPEKPYKERYRCTKENLICELDIRDENHTCSLCGSRLKPLNQFAPLVANYSGGQEDYYSFAGQAVVKGDVEKTFTNLLVYGTGLGPIGVTRGCFLIDRLGGAEVTIEDSSRAVRCLGFVFASEESRQKAQTIIEAFLPEATDKMQEKMSEFGGRISAVDFDLADAQLGCILYVDFVAEFTQFRGHGDISRAVGFIKTEVEEKLASHGVSFEWGVIAQGHDGDLKLSPRNKRGRKAMAQVRIPVSDFEGFLKVSPEKFLSFVQVDKIGSQKLGSPFYSGMGGEILPAIYKATKVNPHSPLVSCFQNIFAERDQGDVVYRVELPNIEVGVLSSREGLMSPVGREAMRIMGIQTAKEFAASVAAQVLAGEFNLALEISREKLYEK
jgi:hypothetical protein